MWGVAETRKALSFEVVSVLSRICIQRPVDQSPLPSMLSYSTRYVFRTYRPANFWLFMPVVLTGVATR